jgi:molybdopterin/thiamine biosynthesis adenylyltransferase
MQFTNEHLTRQLDIIPLDILGTPITVIGGGAIGSFTTLALAKMGFSNLTVYDHDTIETVNMNSQFYRLRDVGQLKVSALRELVKDFTGVEIRAVPQRYMGGIFPGIVISAVDSMEVRGLIWNSHRNKSPFTRAVIDPRMGAETALLYAMNPMVEKDNDSYSKTLYTDKDAVQERCTAKATMYTACMLSGQVAKTVKDLLTGEHTRVLEWSMKHDQFKAWRFDPEKHRAG